MAIGVKQMKAGDPHLDFKLDLTEATLELNDVIQIKAEVYVPTDSTPDGPNRTWDYHPTESSYTGHQELAYVGSETILQIDNLAFNEEDEDYKTDADAGIPLGVKIVVLKRSGSEAPYTYNPVTDTINYVAENDSNDPTKNQVVSGDMLQGVYENPTPDGHEGEV